MDINLLNVGVVIILCLGLIQGRFNETLYNGLVDTFIIFSSLMFSCAYFRQAAEIIEKYGVKNFQYGCLISFCTICMATLGIFYAFRARWLQKFDVPSYPFIDKIGCHACGVFCGVLAAGTLIFIIRIAPIPRQMYRNFPFLNKRVIFNIDEILPRAYGLFVQEKDKYDRRDFMKSCDYRMIIEKRKKDEERRKLYGI